ncbi:MAG: exodeoxyribonuclease VII small subunit [Pseudomonadota bacterium]
MTKSKNNIEKLDFETALEKLEEIVEKLGSGKVNLEEMVDLYEQGIALKDHCSKKLSDAKMKVEILVKKESAINN